MIDTRQRAAQARMSLRSPAESRMYRDGQQNAGGIERVDDNGEPYYDEASRTDYPRMLYRQTDTKKYQEWADGLHEGSEEKMVINDFEGLLCDTLIVQDAGEAELAAGDGWDISPNAAYGIETGIVAAVSAKDEEIARLRAALDEANRPRRGRPPKEGIDEVREERV